MGLRRYTSVVWFIPQFGYDCNICIFLQWQNISCCFPTNLVDVAGGGTMEHTFSIGLEEFDLVALL